MFKLGFTASNAARASSLAGSAASDDASSDEDLPGHSNMWCSLLEAAYHHSIGELLAMNMCHSSKAAPSQSCHFAVFVNPVARSSTHKFFTSCDVQLQHERTAQAACLQRRHKQLSAVEASQCSVAGAFFFRYHTAGELRLTLQEEQVVARSPIVYERAPHIQ